MQNVNDGLNWQFSTINRKKLFPFCLSNFQQTKQRDISYNASKFKHKISKFGTMGQCMRAVSIMDSVWGEKVNCLSHGEFLPIPMIPYNIDQLPQSLPVQFISRVGL